MNDRLKRSFDGTTGVRVHFVPNRVRVHFFNISSPANAANRLQQVISDLMRTASGNSPEGGNGNREGDDRFPESSICLALIIIASAGVPDGPPAGLQ